MRNHGRKKQLGSTTFSTWKPAKIQTAFQKSYTKYMSLSIKKIQQKIQEKKILLQLGHRSLGTVNLSQMCLAKNMCFYMLNF